MEILRYTISGNTLLINNPQSVDVFNKYAKAKKQITGKRKKTDEDHIELRRLEVESKIYFDKLLKVFIPSSWVMAAIAGRSFKQAKISKADIRSSVFTNEEKIKLHYADDHLVNELSDISGNPIFVKTLLLKQGQVKLAKSAPCFKNWSFSSSLVFDPEIIDESSLIQILKSAALYGGFGDFRPTYGRAELNLLSEKQLDDIQRQEKNGQPKAVNITAA